VSTITPARRTRQSALGRYSWLTLGVTLLLASALLTGDLWLTRAGAVVAFLGGLISCLLAWREVNRQRASFELRSTLELRQHGAKLRAEREQHRRVLGVLQRRNQDLRGRAITATAEVTQLRHEVTRLQDENADLRRELVRLDDLRSAEVLALPRRATGAISPREEVLWAEGDLPTVVDLKAVTAAPFGMQRQG